MAATGSAPFVTAVVAGLEDRRVELISIVAPASVAAGRPMKLLPLVETLVVENPFSEPLWEALARLLYACGRQKDALDRLATVRRVLVEELGLDPSPAIVALEHNILTHDPCLRPAGAPAASAIASEGEVEVAHVATSGRST